MDKKILTDNHLKVFFIGIGGISMSGLAKLLLGRGYVVSGSDKSKSIQTKELEALGATVYYEHNALNVKGADLVVYSCAIDEDNPELAFAKANGIVAVKRSEILGEIISGFKKSVAISGCHGKTTCTAMLGEILQTAKKDPTIFLGGEYKDYGNFLSGESDFAIAEACEYKKSFLDIKPKIAVVLNLDNDHLDSYDGMKDVVVSFKKFVGDRLAVINSDEKYINDISNSTTVTFGIENVATYYAKDIKETETGVSFTTCAYAKPYGKINLKINGRHNVYNALAAFAVADLLSISFWDIKKGLENFCGVKRRNEYLGEANGVKYYADYAHHPTEIKATLKAFSRGKNDFITVFQPHTYSRTRILMNDFISAFEGYDNIIIYKSYSAREKFDVKGSAKTLQERLSEKTQICSYAHTAKELEEKISENSKDKKRILFIGAGDIYQIANAILSEKQKVQKNIRK